MSIQVKISKISINEFESRSWMMINIVLPKIYFGSVEGLMGNYNGDANDDLRSRGGEIVKDSSNDEAIYNAMVTCKTRFKFYTL